MTASGMEEGERVDDGADTTEQRVGPKQAEDAKRDSLRDNKRDSQLESKRAILRDMKMDSFEETKRPNLREMKKDSFHESKRDSLRDLKRDSLRDSKRDSLIESGRDSPRMNSRRESGRDSPRKDSERRNTYSKGQEATKTPAERKRASGRSLDKNIMKKEKKFEDNEKKADGDMVETASMAAKRKALVLERRMLCGCTGLVGLAALVWLTAVSTESWFTVHAPTPAGLYINATARYFLYSTSGLFRLCRYARRNHSSPIQRVCWLHEVFPTEDKLKAGIWVDRTIINYTRTEIFFSILSFILMVMGFLFSIYTFRNPRYMFKRLAAGIHFMSGATVMVVIEVLINSIDYERLSLNVVHPKEAYHTYGYSFYLGWVVFIFNSFASITFLVYSKKRKGDKAPNEEIALADEPTIIGR